MQKIKLTTTELERKSPEAFKIAEKTPLIIVLDNIRSAHNIGSVFRTADAFLIKAVYICGFSAYPPNREIEKTALGATKSVEWKYFQHTLEAINQLKSEKTEIWAVEQVDKSEYLNEFSIEKEKTYALVFGNEVKGVDQQIIDQCLGCIEIPQSGTKHSLNIAVSMGIVLWDFYRKLKL
ncbi:MAG: RNA methyltransferase [Bacteroidetes bacterium]|nr:RNA methyltransferase [Bacteroidota bacterium]HET6243517.1 RNA methyltransferase [Bacteroidia bacterium]